MTGAQRQTASHSAEKVRAFVAIELPPPVLTALHKLGEELKRQVRDQTVRWVTGDGIHLTLKFLGDVPVVDLPLIRLGLERACQGLEPFAFTCGGLGCFPDLRRPRVVWVGVQEPSGALQRLQQAIEAEIAPLGYPTEARGFTPHLTLGRVQRAASVDEIRRLGKVVSDQPVGQIAKVDVDTVSLMRSELHSTGAVYTCLARVILGAST